MLATHCSSFGNRPTPPLLGSAQPQPSYAGIGFLLFPWLPGREGEVLSYKDLPPLDLFTGFQIRVSYRSATSARPKRFRRIESSRISHASSQYPLFSLGIPVILLGPCPWHSRHVGTKHSTFSEGPLPLETKS